jgi:hypothetical protein
VFSNFITNHKELIKDVTKLALVFGGLKLSLLGYDFAVALSTTLAGRFNMTLLATKAEAYGAAAGMNILTLATSKFFWYITAAIGAYELLTSITDKQNKKEGYILRNLPKNIDKRQFAMRHGMEQLLPVGTKSSGEKLSSHVSDSLYNSMSENYDKLLQFQKIKIERNKAIADSTENSFQDLQLQGKLKSDSTMQSVNDSAFQSVGKLGMSMPQQTVKVIIDNRTPNPVSVSNNGNAAKPVAFKNVTT